MSPEERARVEARHAGGETIDDTRLVKGDVAVEAAPGEKCWDCTNSPANFLVMVDFRSAGIRVPVGGRLCQTCAGMLARRLRDGLPS